MSNLIEAEELIQLLRDSKRLASGNAKLRRELIGDIDPLDPNLSKADRLLVLRACKKSPSFFIWLLKLTIDIPEETTADTLRGEVSRVIMANSSVFYGILTETMLWRFPTLNGKKVVMSAWYFSSGDLCVIASNPNSTKTYKHVVRTARVVIERNGASLTPAGTPARHLAGLFDREWKSK